MLQYLRDNPNYVIALIVTAALLIAACVLGFFIKKYNLLRFLDRKKDGSLEDRQINGNASEESPHMPEATAPLEGLDKTQPEEDGQNGATDGEGGDKSSYSGESNQTEVENLPAAEDPQGGKSSFSELVRSYDVYGEYDDEKRKAAAQRRTAIVPAEEELKPIDENTYYISGTWKIVRTGSTYAAELCDIDGVLMMRSQNYLAFADAVRAIDNLKNYVSGNNFKVDVKNGKFYFKLLSPSGRLMCKGEPCDTNEECIRRIETVKHIASRAEIVKG